MNKKEKGGFLIRIGNSRPVRWDLTEKAKELANLLGSYKQELTNLNIDTTKDVSQFYLKNNQKLRK